MDLEIDTLVRKSEHWLKLCLPISAMKPVQFSYYWSLHGKLNLVVQKLLQKRRKSCQVRV